jgi:hypothetical protein
MNKTNRDLLVLLKENGFNKEAVEFELEQINRMLTVYETVESLCIAHEVADLNKYRMLHKHRHISEVLKQRELRPFTFLLNKN